MMTSHVSTITMDEEKWSELDEIKHFFRVDSRGEAVARMIEEFEQRMDEGGD